MTKQNYKKGFTTFNSYKRGFTLVELLVVIAIIGVLAAVVVLVINPLELTRRSRDAARLTDFANLQQAINVAAQESTQSGGQVLCNGAAYPCGGSASEGSSNTGTRASSGAGWVKVNLGAQQSVSVPTLPIDPLNDGTYHYTYCANNDQWELSAKLESQQQVGKMSADGGNDPVLYEVGSNLTLIAPSGGSCAY